MRLLQLWRGLFAASIVVYVAARIGIEAGAPPSVGVLALWTVVLLGGGGVVLVLAIIARVAVFKRRLRRGIAARRDAAIVAPYDVLEQAFGPLVESGAARGLAVALVVPGHPRICFPATDSDAQQTDLYEIGSLTKPMTAEVLATMIVDGTATMATRVGDVLSDAALPPSIAAITVAELATHQSRLPRIPRTIRMALAALFSGDPYRWLSRADLVRSLASARRTTARGTYSNFGFAVLAQMVGILDGNEYRRALESRLLRPLGLADTHLDPDGDVALRHPRGHDLLGVPTPRWHAGGIAGAGGVSMTLADGAAWLAAHVNPPAAFQEIVAMVTRPLASLGPDRVGMGWVIREIDGTDIVWHNGGTGGFSSFAAFDAMRGVGVIAFAASSHISALDRAGFHVICACAARWGHGAGSGARDG